jgi:hypothetical protein
MNEDPTLTVYRRLIHDKRISHGAFRLWHYLRDRKDAFGKTWPEQRDIARELRCKTHSLPGWTLQLVQAGYLATEKKGQNHHLEYTILFGDGKGDMPEWATRGKVQTGNTRTDSRSPNGQVATPIEATPRVAEKGDRSNNSGVTTGSKGKIAPPVFEPVKRGLYPREYDDLIREAEAERDRAKGNRAHYVADKLTEQGQAVIEAWRNRIRSLRKAKRGELE